MATTSTQIGQIIEIYNSRKTIIDLLEAQKYDVSHTKILVLMRWTLYWRPSKWICF